MEITTGMLAERLAARLIGSEEVLIRGVAGIEFAMGDQVSFVSDRKHRSKALRSEAGAMIVAEPLEGVEFVQLVVDDVEGALLATLEMFAPQYPPPAEGVDETARVGKDVTLGADVSIGAYAVIEDGATIGDGTAVGPWCRVGRNTRIGARCRLESHVAVHHDCIIGNAVILQAHVAVGSVGFGYVYREGRHVLVPHIGTVVIEDFVEVGANSCIDRAKFGATRIGAGTKIDNLVQIGHNVTIGRCCLIAGVTGLGGSCRLGDGVVVAGQVGIRDHVSLGDGAMVGAQSLVTGDVPAGMPVFGTPALEKGQALRAAGLTKKLPELFSRVRAIEAAMKEREPVASGETRKRRGFGGAGVLSGWLAAALFAGALLAMLVGRPLLDPEEVRIEKAVRSFQDGNDTFYVERDARLEDLRTNRHLLMVRDVGEAIEKVLADGREGEDYYFLVSSAELERVRQSEARNRLYVATEVLLRGRPYALLTTETDRPFLRL